MTLLMTILSVPAAVSAENAPEPLLEIEETTEDIFSGRIPGSEVQWEYDSCCGKLVISGFGDCEVFQSADDQPWANFRTEIREVWFDGMDELAISNLAYWFSGCSSLQTAEIPYTTPSIGTAAFAGCPSLSQLMLYYSDTDFGIAPGAFYTDSASPLTVSFVMEDVRSREILGRYDWESDNRTVHFADIYGISDMAASYCPVCQTKTFYTLEYEYNNYATHYVRHWCVKCGTDQNGGTTVSHTFSSAGNCIYCQNDGADTDYPTVCTHTSTYTSWSGCNWYQYCNSCGTLVNSGTTHSSYTYGSWTYYSDSQHRRLYSCSRCGSGSYSYGSHSLYTEYAQVSSSQHSIQNICSVCSSSVGTTSYASHTDTDSNGLCDACGYSMTVFSVTIPASLTLTVSEQGHIYAAGNASIVNRSTGSVAVTNLQVTAENGWTLVPYSQNMAAAKVDSKQIGFLLNGVQTAKTGGSETLTLTENWIIPKGESLPLDYDAVVSASSTILSEQVLTVIFLLEWA